MTDAHAQSKNSGAIRLIAIFKLLSGVLLLVVALGALRLLRGDIADVVRYWLEELRVDPHNHFIDTLLTRATGVDRRTLVEVGAGSFLYATLLLTEGVGLLLRKRWAEYLTVIATGLFIPLEIYEVFKSASVGKGVVLALNIAIVGYLAMRLRQQGSHRNDQSLTEHAAGSHHF